MWKILTAFNWEEIYHSLVYIGLLPEEQKAYHRGTNDLQYIYQYILKESKARWKNVTIALIVYKKAYGMVPQSWITVSLKM